MFKHTPAIFHKPMKEFQLFLVSVIHVWIESTVDGLAYIQIVIESTK